jgi:hypothetical protein
MFVANGDTRSMDYLVEITVSKKSNRRRLTSRFHGFAMLDFCIRIEYNMLISNKSHIHLLLDIHIVTKKAGDIPVCVMAEAGMTSNQLGRVL